MLTLPASGDVISEHSIVFFVPTIFIQADSGRSVLKYKPLTKFGQRLCVFVSTCHADFALPNEQCLNAV
jgi:hypothetical protein